MRKLMRGCGLFALWFLSGSLALARPICAQAEEVTLLYTGETHAMLYTCSCPKETDGGIARRATLLKQLKKTNPNALLFDSGGFFAGGLMDEYTLNTQLDIERTRVNLKAMDIMKYDGVAVGDDEFNFGKEFLAAEMARTSIPFLSCNIKEKNEHKPFASLKPYIIKQVGTIKIGIIAVTPPAASKKASELLIEDPVLAVKEAVSQLKQQKPDLIVLLSHLGENEDGKVLKESPEINIVVVGHNRAKEETAGRIGNTLVLRPVWQGRSLGKAILIMKDKKIVDYKVEAIRLSDKVADDPEILSILPRCFSDGDCKKEGLVGICREPGTLKANCLFAEPSKVAMTIVTTKDCSVCDTSMVTNIIKKHFPGLTVSYLYYPNENALKLVQELNITAFPAYLLDKSAGSEKTFDQFKEHLDLKGNYYMFKTSFSGVGYYLNRKRVKGALDLFISLYDKDASALLAAIKDFNPTIHFLSLLRDNQFDAAKGLMEIEEYLRSVCVQKHYPGFFWDYISCRTKRIASSWWEDCLPQNTDPALIRTCAMGQEGAGLLKENISLTSELNIMAGPTYLMDNQEIFSTSGTPTKEELKKVLKR